MGFVLGFSLSVKVLGWSFYSKKLLFCFFFFFLANQNDVFCLACIHVMYLNNEMVVNGSWTWHHVIWLL